MGQLTRLVLLVPLIFFTATAHAVDRGQYENVSDDVRKWYDVRGGAYWVPINGLWWQVPEKAIVRNAGNPLGEAVVWYVNLRGNIEIRCFVPADAA
jgi:hypothetical protein